MGYIGNEPTTGHFPVDNFTSSGGSTYTLAKAPASAGAIEVSVQGVLQPTTAYTVSGTTLTMAGVTTGVKIFVRHLGETLSLPTPADGSVTTAKLGTNSVDGTKIAMGSDARGDILYHGASDYARLAKGSSGQVLTMGANDPAWATASGGVPDATRPAFLVGADNQLDVTGNGTDYTVLWAAEMFDQGSNFASNTFTAPVTGRYFLAATIKAMGWNGNEDYSLINIITSNRLYTWQIAHTDTVSNSTQSFQTSVVADMDASDTATVQFYTNGAGGDTIDVKGYGTGHGHTHFSGCLIA